jgi:hypothetical protein
MNLARLMGIVKSEYLESPTFCSAKAAAQKMGHPASALTNCGGFPEVFASSELSGFGLLTDFGRAVEVQRLLRSRFPEEIHANCHLWAVFRSTT